MSTAFVDGGGIGGGGILDEAPTESCDGYGAKYGI